MGKKIVIGGIIALLLLVVVAVAGNSWWQAKTMRTKIYQPLLEEVKDLDEVVQASNVSHAVRSTTYISLKKDPLWDQVPPDLRSAIQDTYEKAWDCQSEMVVVRSHAGGRAVLAAQLVRKEAHDQAWIKKVTAGSVPPTAKGKWSRREPEIDRSDPAHPRLTMPGGPIWQVSDWLGYPENIAELDREWSDNEFLFLSDSGFDRWTNRITRDDLRRANLTLEQFMANLTQSVESFGRLQAYRQFCRAAIPMVATLRKQLEEKVR